MTRATGKRSSASYPAIYATLFEKVLAGTVVKIDNLGPDAGKYTSLRQDMHRWRKALADEGNARGQLYYGVIVEMSRPPEPPYLLVKQRYGEAATKIEELVGKPEPVSLAKEKQRREREETTTPRGEMSATAQALSDIFKL